VITGQGVKIFVIKPGAGGDAGKMKSNWVCTPIININKDWGIYVNANNPLYFTVTKNESGKLTFKSTNGNVVLEKL
jgi:hypothetical protein